jgi:hypothetical protein
MLQNHMQLQGFDRKRDDFRHEMLWKGLYQTDRFTSLMIGTNYALHEASCNISMSGDNSRVKTYENDAMMLLASYVGKVIDMVINAEEQFYSAVLILDQELIDFEFHVISEPDKLNPFAPKNNEQKMKSMDNLLGQLIFYYMRMILHLGYMVKHPKAAEYQYSHTSCLACARTILQIFKQSRTTTDDLVKGFNIIDYLTNIASVILVIGHILAAVQPVEAIWIEDYQSVQVVLNIQRAICMSYPHFSAQQSYHSLQNSVETWNNVRGGTPVAGSVSLPFMGIITF